MGDAEIEGAVDDLAGAVDADASAKVVGAEADEREAEAGGPEATLFHRWEFLNRRGRQA